MSQDLTVTVGQAYQLTYRTFFDKCDQQEGFVGVMLNHQPVKTTDACDLGAGAFKSNSYNFTATVNPLNLHFDFVAGETPVIMKIDNGVYNFQSANFLFIPFLCPLCDEPRDGFSWEKKEALQYPALDHLIYPLDSCLQKKKRKRKRC